MKLRTTTALCAAVVAVVAGQPEPRTSVPGAKPPTVAARDPAGPVLFGSTSQRADDGVVALRWSRDGRRVTFATKNTVTVSDAITRVTLDRYEIGPAVTDLGPNGEVLVESSRRVSLYRRPTEKPEVCATRSGTYAAQLTPDGKRVSMAHWGGKFTVETPVSGKVSEIRSGNTDYGRCAFDADARRIVCGPFANGRGSLKVFDVETGKLLRDLESPEWRFRHGAFVGDDFVVVSTEKAVRVWDLRTGSRLREFPLSAAALAVSADGKFLAVASTFGSPFQMRITIDDTLTGRRRLVISDFDAYISHLALSPDGRRIAAAFHDSHDIRIWDTTTGEEIDPRGGHRHPVICLRYTPDGNTLISKDDGGGLVFWDVATRRERHRLLLRHPSDSPRFDRSPSALAISPDGREVACGDRSAAPLGPFDSRRAPLRVFDIADPRKSRVVETSPATRIFAYSHDGRTLFASSDYRDEEHPVLDGYNAQAWASPTRYTDSVIRIEGDRRFNSTASVIHPSPFGPEVLVDCGVRLLTFDRTSGSHLRTSGEDHPKFKAEPIAPFAHSALSPDGMELAIVTRKPKEGGSPWLLFYDPVTNKLLDRVAEKSSEPIIQAAPTSVAYSPSGRLLAVGCPEGNVRVYDAVSRRLLKTFAGQRGTVYTVAFSPDGKQLAAGAADTTIALYDVTAIKPDPLPKAGDPKAVAADAAGDDAAKAFPAVAALASLGDEVLSRLPVALKRVPAIDPAKIAVRVALLDDDDKALRDAAQKELVAYGPPAEEALRKALAETDRAETRRRLREIIRVVHAARDAKACALEARAVRVLELAGTPKAVALLREVASGQEGAELTRRAAAALVRLGKK